MWFDLTQAKDRFDECPDQEIQKRALIMIRGHETIDGPSLKRRSKLSKSKFHKIKAQRSKPEVEKKEPPKRRRKSSRKSAEQDLSYADLGME